MFLSLCCHPARGAGVAGVAPDKPKTIGEVVDGIVIVEAKVVSVEQIADLTDDDGRVARATMVMTRVYCGRGVARGDTFWAIVHDGVPGYLHLQTSRRPMRGIPQVGDVRLWQIWPLLDGKGWRANLDMNDRGVGVRLLYGGARPAAQAAAELEVATRLQWLDDARDEPERLRRLTELARGGNPHLAEAACSILNQATAVPARGKVARELFLDARVPLPVRAELDEMLCRWKEPGWAGSDRRQEAFLKMAADARDKDEFDAINYRLRDAAQKSYSSMRQCLDVTSEELRNPRLLTACDQLYTLGQFAIAPHGAKERDEAFDYFRDLLKSSPHQQVRRAAAGALGSVGLREFPLTDEQLGVVRKFKEDERDEAVLFQLDLALERAEAKRHPQTRPVEPPPRIRFFEGEGDIQNKQFWMSPYPSPGHDKNAEIVDKPSKWKFDTMICRQSPKLTRSAGAGSARIVVIAFLLLWCHPGRGAGVAADRPKAIGEVVDGILLVEARVVEVKEDAERSGEGGRVATATLVVTRVYCGRGIARGDTFRAWVYDGLPGVIHRHNSMPPMHGIPKVADVRLWQVRRELDGRGWRANADMHDREVVSIPLLYGPDRPAARAAAELEVAQRLQWLDDARDEPERLRRLAELARTGNPHLAEAACTILDRAPAVAGRVDLARDLFLDVRVPLPSRMELDGMLCKWKAPGWAGSPRRQEAFLEMAGGARDKADFEAIGWRLNHAAEDGHSSMRRAWT